jgi:RNA polymerase sigma-70 factor (ECF subfamily)
MHGPCASATRDAGGDYAALRAQIAPLLPELRAFARFLAAQRSEADDLVQETLLRALAKLAQFQPDSSLRAWLFAILRNLHYEQRRRQRTEARVMAQQLPALSSGPAQEAASDLSDLHRQLQRLPPLLREALVLVGAQGLDYQEAAAICAVQVGTLKARVSRARAQIAAMRQS